MPTRDTAWAPGTPCWLVCFVPDGGAAAEFYRSLFGWQIVGGPPEAGGFQMAMKGGRPVAGLDPHRDPALPSGWVTFFASADAEASAAAIRAAGGRILTEPVDLFDAGRMFLAADPAGATFGVWQAGRHTGCQVFNEPGAYVWNELHTHDFAGAQEFYTAVFGWHYSPMSASAEMVYSTFALAGTSGMAASLGGFNDLAVVGGDAPAHWLVWMQADDVDATTGQAVTLGSSVLMGPETTSVGRMAIIAGPQGEWLGLIHPTDPGTSDNAAAAGDSHG